MAAFKPENSGNRSSGNFEPRGPMPVPKEGSRKARVSLIVDMGIQNREDFVDEQTGETKPQKPCHQVAVFADLVADVVDYGGNIGKAQYRLPLNKVFKGQITGINFTTTPPKDGDGKIIKDKAWTLHPASPLTKLAKAVGKPQIISEEGDEGLDISLLLDQPFMAQVEVKVTESKDKKDDEGNPIVYKNVNYRGCAPVPTVEDDEGNETPLPVAELKQPARLISFKTATVEDIKYIRAGLLKQIKQANNYVGSAMQKAVEAYEAANKSGDDDKGDDQKTPPKEESKPKPDPAKKAATKAKPAPAPEAADADEDLPF